MPENNSLTHKIFSYSNSEFVSKRHCVEEKLYYEADFVNPKVDKVETRKYCQYRPRSLDFVEFYILTFRCEKYSFLFTTVYN